MNLAAAALTLMSAAGFSHPQTIDPFQDGALVERTFEYAPGVGVVAEYEPGGRSMLRGCR